MSLVLKRKSNKVYMYVKVLLIIWKESDKEMIKRRDREVFRRTP